jgi:4-hydroxybenzoyl-CoA thioesterase
MFVHTRTITIEWGDCDPAGIVFYPRYFAMFDASTAALFAAALGYDKRAMLARFDAIGFPMVDTGARFLVPSRYGDVVTIESTVKTLGRSSFEIRHTLMRGDVVAIEAHEKRVWAAADPETPGKIKGTPIPDEVIEALCANN